MFEAIFVFGGSNPDNPDTSVFFSRKMSLPSDPMVIFIAKAILNLTAEKHVVQVMISQCPEFEEVDGDEKGLYRIYCDVEEQDIKAMRNDPKYEEIRN